MLLQAVRIIITGLSVFHVITVIVVVAAVVVVVVVCLCVCVCVCVCTCTEFVQKCKHINAVCVNNIRILDFK